MYNLGFSQVRQRLYLHFTDLRLVFLNSLNLQTHSHMLLNLLQHFFRATVSVQFAEISIKNMHNNLFDLGFSHVRPRLYFYCTDRGLIFFNSSHFYLHSHVLLDLVQPLLRAAVSLELVEISIRRQFLLCYSVYDQDFSQLRQRLYLHCTDRRLVFLNHLHLFLHSHMLLDLVQLFLRAAVNL